MLDGKLVPNFFMLNVFFNSDRFSNSVRLGKFFATCQSAKLLTELTLFKLKTLLLPPRMAQACGLCQQQRRHEVKSLFIFTLFRHKWHAPYWGIYIHSIIQNLELDGTSDPLAPRISTNPFHLLLQGIFRLLHSDPV